MNQPDDDGQRGEYEPMQWTWLDGSSPWGEDTQRVKPDELDPLVEKCRRMQPYQHPRQVKR